MKRWVIAGLAVLLGLSLAVNGVLGWIAWRSAREYVALSRQFVKARQDLKGAEERAKRLEAAQAKTAVAAATPSAPAAAPAPAGQSGAAAADAAPAAAPDPGSTAAIKARYEPGFLSLQSECEAQLNGLLGEAKAEYQAAKAAGKSVDVSLLGAKYYARADGLRRDCDRKVEGLLAQMAGELRAQGLPLDLVDEVRMAYQDRIVQRQAEIMAKAQ